MKSLFFTCVFLFSAMLLWAQKDTAKPAYYNQPLPAFSLQMVDSGVSPKQHSLPNRSVIFPTRIL